MKFVLASHNKNKVKEMVRLFSDASIDAEILTLDDIGFDGDIEESGITFRENALIKAMCPAKLGYIGIADDSGLCVDALGGAPGVYSARWSGDVCDDKRNNEKLLSELSSVPHQNRTARYESVICMCFPSNRAPVFFSGICEGTILNDYRGSGGFGYDPLFCPSGTDKTFAQISLEEKNQISHRAKAMRALCDYIKNGGAEETEK